jgi:DNA-binding NarL/FixJ family response regulator
MTKLLLFLLASSCAMKECSPNASTVEGKNLMPVRILLADDHEVVREGFRALLEDQGFQVVGEASDGYEAVRLAKEFKPAIAVLDLSMPLLSGIQACREIAKVSPFTRTIILTMYRDDQYVLDALRAGVSGYILKSHAGKDLIEAIREVSAGSTYLGPEVSKAVVKAYQAGQESAHSSLSSRETQVLQLVAQGKSTKEVASTLGISVKTASAHRASLMRKLDIHETAGLVRYAIRAGLIAA